MNSDFRVSITWMTSLKRKKLQRKLGPAGVLALLDLWSVAAEHRPGGVLRGWDKDDLELQSGWEGKPGELISALVELRLLDLDEKTGTYSIHNWEKWNHWATGAESRSEKASAAAAARWGKKNRKKNQDNDSNAPSMLKQCSGHGGSIAPTLTSPYPSSPSVSTTPPAGEPEEVEGEGNQKDGGGVFFEDQKDIKNMEEIEEYLSLGILFGGENGGPVNSPPGWTNSARKRIEGQGGLTPLEKLQRDGWRDRQADKAKVKAKVEESEKQAAQEAERRAAEESAAASDPNLVDSCKTEIQRMLGPIFSSCSLPVPGPRTAEREQARRQVLHQQAAEMEAAAMRAAEQAALA